jgi:hypothetical protein
MNDLYRALGDISSIRKQMASTTEFRGYGPATLAGTGLLAMLAGGVQRLWVPNPANHVSAYLSVWISTAVVCATLAGVQMYTRTRRIHSGMSNEMLRMAVEQFMPSVGAGLFLTIVVVHYVPAVSWMLPGMWQIIFGLGVFSSCRFLPRPMNAAGAWYVLTGLGCIAIGVNGAFSPWEMAIPFGVGQLLVAAILQLNRSEDGDEV